MPALPAVVLLWLQVQFGALRVLERLPGTMGDVALVAVWVATAIGLWRFVRQPPRWAVLHTPWPAALLVAAVAVCALAVYPEVDGRRSSGGGSDADDAVVLVADRVRDGEDPFGADTYLGNPPTTGPGSVLWAAPFPTRRAYACAVVVALAATLLVLRRWFGWEVASLTSLLVAASVPFWEGVAQGTDHLAMACALALLTSGVHLTVRTGRRMHTGRWGWAMVAVALGAVATWRAAYLHLPVLLAIAVWPRSRRDAAIVGALGLAVALALHAVLLSWTAGGWDAYDPVQQLLVKSDDDLSASGQLLVVAAVVAGGLLVLRELRRPAPDASTLVLAGIGAPMAAIAIAGVFTADDPAAWSEASYLLPTLVLASVVASRTAVASRSA